MSSTVAAAAPSSSSATGVRLALARLARLAARLDVVTRRWLDSNTPLLSSASDLTRSLLFLTSSTSTSTSGVAVEIRVELASTLFALLNVYRAYPYTSVPCILLNVVQASQLLIEILICTYRPSRRVDAILVIELIKAIIRVAMFSRNGFNKLLTTGHQALYDDKSEESESDEKLGCKCGIPEEYEQYSTLINVNKGPRVDTSILRIRHHNLDKQQTHHHQFTSINIEGLSPPPSILTKVHNNNNHEQQDELLEALFVIAYERRSNWLFRLFVSDIQCNTCRRVVNLPKHSLTSTLANINQSMTVLPPLFVAAELVHILRPLLHVALVRRMGWRSWRPYLVALSLDVVCRVALARYLKASASASGRLEMEEKKKRLANLLLYLGRTPLFDILLNRIVRKLITPVTNVPVVGSLASATFSLLTVVQQYWYYSSES